MKEKEYIEKMLKRIEEVYKVKLKGYQILNESGEKIIRFDCGSYTLDYKHPY